MKFTSGEVYIALPAYNDIHGTIALYSVSKFSTFAFRPTHIVSVHAYMRSPPPFWGVFALPARIENFVTINCEFSLSHLI